MRMTLEKLGNPVAVHDLVGRRPSRRWARAIPVIRRADGISVAGWFSANASSDRVAAVRRAIVEGLAWSPLLRVAIPKRTGGCRAIDMPIVLDAAVLYLVLDWLQSHAESVLTRVAVAFRPGRSFPETVLAAQRRLMSQPCAAVMDIKSFFDSVAWTLLDRVIDGLPADDGVKLRLSQLVRARVVDRATWREVLRAEGIPQGLSISPVLANLVLAEFDREVAQALGKHRATLTRYCDDILVLAPTLDALERSVNIIRDRLAARGLQVKPGTGQLLDTRQTPVHWLGLALTASDVAVPDDVIEVKAQELQARLDAGVLSPHGVEESLLHKEKHYGRIIGPENTARAIASMREKIHYGSSPMNHGRRKEGIERLHYLVTDR